MLIRGRWPAFLGAAGLVIGGLLSGCLDAGAPVVASLDSDLDSALSGAGVYSITPPAPPAPALVELGRLLMFDKILSGNKNISCGTCHHPSYHSTDNLTLAIGTGGFHAGVTRQLRDGHFSDRNTSDLYNRALPGWKSMFWDGRVARAGADFATPAGAELPPAMGSLLAAQAMFPVAERDEMRGHAGDTTATGEPNELALLSDGDWTGIWNGVMARVLAIPEYVALFRAAFPAVDSADLGFSHAAIAIAAFESASYTLLDSPFDRYLAGHRAALSGPAKRGALLFYGRGRCSTCHSGPFLTDQEFHNIAVPQLKRPGVDSLDQGRGSTTGSPADRFAFRTPPLRNVSLTGPWMHDGVYTTLEAVVRHYRNPAQALANYDATQLDQRFRGLYQGNAADEERILSTLDPAMRGRVDLTEAEVTDLVAFLRSLTDPRALDQVRIIPGRVPSGLPVFR